MVTYQRGATRRLLEFGEAGNFVVFINTHSFNQVLAYSPGLAQAVIVDRIIGPETTMARNRILDYRCFFAPNWR